MTFINNIKGAFSTDASADRGSLVETVLLIAGFAVVAILVVSWIGGAIAGQAANVSACIAGANTNDPAAADNPCVTDTYGVENGVQTNINTQRGDRF